MDPTHERVQELTEQIIERVNKAELALNRHGFTQDDKGDWKAPGMPNWAGASELRLYLQMHFPEIERGKGTLNQKAIAALMEAEQRRNDAASNWIRSSLPSLKLKEITVMSEPDELSRELRQPQEQLAEVTFERDALREHINTITTPEILPTSTTASSPILKAIWPDPKNHPFNLADRRDPYNMAERHTELRRRSTDIDED